MSVVIQINESQPLPQVVVAIKTFLGFVDVGGNEAQMAEVRVLG